LVAAVRKVDLDHLPVLETGSGHADPDNGLEL
jgi:hypothetical protein